MAIHTRGNSDTNDDISHMINRCVSDQTLDIGLSQGTKSPIKRSYYTKTQHDNTRIMA